VRQGPGGIIFPLGVASFGSAQHVLPRWLTSSIFRGSRRPCAASAGGRFWTTLAAGSGDVVGVLLLCQSNIKRTLARPTLQWSLGLGPGAYSHTHDCI